MGKYIKKYIYIFRAFYDEWQGTAHERNRYLIILLIVRKQLYLAKEDNEQKMRTGNKRRQRIVLKGRKSLLLLKESIIRKFNYLCFL